jgi:hypothetical protein
MTQNSRTIVRATRGRLGIVAAGVVMAVTMLTPASAVAAPVAGSASPAPTDSSGEGDVTDTMAGTNTLCTSHWKGQGARDPFTLGGYSEVEWTSNPCGFSIQERSWCAKTMVAGGDWSTSGVVVRTNLWDKSSCARLTHAITRGEWRFLSGSGWSTYKTFWTP